MVQWLRALTFLTEDLGSVLSTHMVAHDCLRFPFQRIQWPLWPPKQMLGAQIHMQTKHPCTVNKNLKSYIQCGCFGSTGLGASSRMSVW